MPETIGQRPQPIRIDVPDIRWRHPLQEAARAYISKLSERFQLSPDFPSLEPASYSLRRIASFIEPAPADSLPPVELKIVKPPNEFYKNEEVILIESDDLEETPNNPDFHTLEQEANLLFLEAAKYQAVLNGMDLHPDSSLRHQFESKVKGFRDEALRKIRGEPNKLQRRIRALALAGLLLGACGPVLLPSPERQTIDDSIGLSGRDWSTLFAKHRSDLIFADPDENNALDSGDAVTGWFTPATPYVQFLGLASKEGGVESLTFIAPLTGPRAGELMLVVNDSHSQTSNAGQSCFTTLATDELSDAAKTPERCDILVSQGPDDTLDTRIKEGGRYERLFSTDDSVGLQVAPTPPADVNGFLKEIGVLPRSAEAAADQTPPPPTTAIATSSNTPPPTRTETPTPTPTLKPTNIPTETATKPPENLGLWDESNIRWKKESNGSFEGLNITYTLEIHDSLYNRKSYPVKGYVEAHGTYEEMGDAVAFIINRLPVSENDSSKRKLEVNMNLLTDGTYRPIKFCRSRNCDFENTWQVFDPKIPIRIIVFDGDRRIFPLNNPSYSHGWGVDPKTQGLIFFEVRTAQQARDFQILGGDSVVESLLIIDGRILDFGTNERVVIDQKAKEEFYYLWFRGDENRTDIRVPADAANLMPEVTITP